MSGHDLVQCVLWGFVIAFAQATLWTQGGPLAYFMVTSIVVPALCGIVFGQRRAIKELLAQALEPQDDKTVE